MNIDNNEPTLNKDLKNALRALEDFPERTPNAALRGRNLFLAQARKLKKTATFSAEQRHSKWINKIHLPVPFRRKEGLSMSTQIISAVLILVTLFGGAGAGTVYAAQSSMPDDLLYPIKTWSEDARLELSASTEKDIELLLEFADRRLEEILEIPAEGNGDFQQVLTRLQEHVDLAAQLYDQTNDPLKSRLQIQQHLMNQQMLLENAPETAQLQRTRAMIQQKIHQLDQTPVDESLQSADNISPTETPDTQDRERLRTDQPDGAGNIDANGYQEEQTPSGPNYNPDAPGQQSTAENPQRTKTPMPEQTGQQQRPNDQNGNPNMDD